jgi:hypothetical protein
VLCQFLVSLALCLLTYVAVCRAVLCFPLQVQVWDIQQQQDSMRPSMDPILKISEGIEGKVRCAAASASGQLSRRCDADAADAVQNIRTAAAELDARIRQCVVVSSSGNSSRGLVRLCC